MAAVQTLFGKVHRFDWEEFQRKLKRPRYLAPILHAIVFVVMLLAASKPGAFDVRGPIAALAFWTLLVLDIPISIVAFSMLWSSAEANSSASLPYLILFLWGIVGTFWWFLLGLSIEAWIRRIKRKQDSAAA